MRGGFRGYHVPRGGPLMRPGFPLHHRGFLGWRLAPLFLLGIFFPFVGLGFLLILGLLRWLF